MALPKLNDAPSYELVIPSTQETISYRPFLVKEQKVLLMGLESGEEKQVVRAVLDTIEACIKQPINVATLSTFDVEYIFTKIRSKSVGETAEISLNCQHCEEANKIVVNLDDYNIGDTIIPETKIPLTETYTVHMKFPTYSDYIAKIGNNLSDQVYQQVILCLDKLETEDELISFKDETEESIVEFIGNLSTDQFDKLMVFVNNLPQMKNDIEYDCEHCKEKNKITLRGLQDFF